MKYSDIIYDEIISEAYGINCDTVSDKEKKKLKHKRFLEWFSPDKFTFSLDCKKTIREAKAKL